eukprot:jgi/Hompol1/7007/HPOL_003817-RA
MSAPYAPIPHIIHQSWKTKELPVKFKMWQATWLERHIGWEYRLWTDDENMELCETHFPWMLEKFKSFSSNILRADTARYMYMYKYGGFYADLDVECLKDHTPIARKGGVVVPLMSRDYKFEHNIPNPWMGSAPGHPFWIHMLKNIQSKTEVDGVEALTGPVMLFQSLREFEILYQNETLPPITYMAREFILPYDWHDNKGLAGICSAQSDNIDPEACKKKIDPHNKAFSITYWSHSWGGDGPGKVDQ